MASPPPSLGSFCDEAVGGCMCDKGCFPEIQYFCSNQFVCQGWSMLAQWVNALCVTLYPCNTAICSLATAVHYAT